MRKTTLVLLFSALLSSTAIAGMISELNLINKDELESFLNKPVYNSTDQIVGNISWCG